MLAGAIFGFNKRWLAPFSGLATANADNKNNEKGDVLLSFVLFVLGLVWSPVQQQLADAIFGFSKFSHWLVSVLGLASRSKRRN